MSSPATPSPVAAWSSYEQTLPDTLPDTARDALRDKFFQENVAPQVLKSGYGLEPSRRAFMDATERPTKATFPRAEVIGKTAYAHATAPLAGLVGDQAAREQQTGEEESAAGAVREAQRQGVWTPPYQMAGAMLGEAPYWVGPMKAAGVAGEALAAGRAAQAGLNVAAGAMVQGSYDAAKAPTGQRLLEGAKGALVGGATVGAFEGVGGIWHALTSKGVEPEAAASIEKLAKGVMPAEGREANDAAKAVVQNPGVAETIQQQVAQSADAAKKAGVPLTMDLGRTDGRIRVDVRGADGQLYKIGGTSGFKFDDLRSPQFAQRLADHLDAGGSVENVRGDASVMQQFNSMVEEARAKSGAFDLQLPDTPIENDEAKGWTSKIEVPEGADVRLEKGIKKPGSPWASPMQGLSDQEQKEIEKSLYSAKDGEEIDVPESYTDGKLWSRHRDGQIDAVDEIGRIVHSTADVGGDDFSFRAEFGPKTKVPSSSLSSLQYDPDAQTLQVKFNSGTTYEASGVPEDEYKSFLTSESKGKYFAQNLKKQYDWQMIDSEGDAKLRNNWIKKHLEKGLVRGSSDIPLSDEGQDHADELAQRIRAKGGLDELHSADLTRHQQTADAIERINSPLVRHQPDPSLRSMALGGLEGQPHDDAIGAVNDLMRDTPDTAMPGVGPHSTSSGESYNDFTRRILPKIKSIMDSSEARPERKIGAVVSSRDIGAVKAWIAKGMPDDFSTDVETMTKSHEMPGDVYRLAKDEKPMLAKRPPSEGYWLHPDGTLERLTKANPLGRAEHDRMAEPGEIGIRDNNISLPWSEAGEFKGFKDENFITAVYKALESYPGRKQQGIHVMTNAPTAETPEATLNSAGKYEYPEGTKPNFYFIDKEDIGEFIDNPSKYLRRVGAKAASRAPLFGYWEKKPPEEAGWTLRKVDMEADADLKPGAYLIRHAETPWNASKSPETVHLSEDEEPTEEPTKLDASKWLEVGEGAQYKETPLARRIHGPVPFLDEMGAKGAAISRFAGEKPTLIYGQDADKNTLFHENLHGHFGYLGIRNDVQSSLSESKIADDLVRNDETLRSYGEDGFTYGDQLEEAYVHAASAVRTGDVMRLQALGDADTDMDSVLDWTKDTSEKVLDRTAELPDSLHKRTLERRMNAVISRATKQLDDVGDQYGTDGTTLDWAKGRYMVLERGGTTKFFDDRETMLKYLEDEHGQPLNVPELVDDSLLPDHLPRLARSMPGPSTLKAPITTDPPPPELSPSSEGKLSGFSTMGYWIRPFNAWLSNVSDQLKRSDLFEAFSKFDKDQVAVNNFTREYAATLRDTLGKYPKERQSDFYRYFEAEPKDQASLAAEFRFSDGELDDMKTMREKFFDPLSQELGLDADWYIRNFAPRIRSGNYDPNEIFPRGPYTNTNTDFFPEKVRTGELDPKDTNLLRVAGTYLRLGARQKFLGDDLDAAGKMVDELNEDGSYKLGLIQPLLKRHLEYLRGTPDYTSKMVNAMAATAMDHMNSAIEAVNGHLPGGLQIPTMEATPGEELSKLILFSYAGELALRPALLARDAAQYFLTTLPVLGNYTWTGLRRVFGYAKEGESSDWYKIPQKYGALIERSDLQTMISQGGAEEASGKFEQFAQKALGMIQWTHNTNRVAAFWGHDAMAQDALENFLRHGDPKQLAKESGMWFMDPPMRNQYLKEAQMLTRGDDLTDISHRIAKDMVELSQWNFKRGANPGIYEYQLGRLFGQYGTWPLNYIEYSRRFARAEDKGAAMGGITRLVAAHSAMLMAGEAFGVDTANWTFTQPMAYGGGPALTVLTSIPQSMDFESQRGAEARSEIRRTFFPGIIPGGEAFETIGNAIRDDDPHFWMRLMGFTPLEERDKLRGWHQMVP